MQFQSAVRRTAAAAIGIALVLAAATGCAPEREVTIDLPAQTDAAFPGEVQTQLEDAVASAMTATGATGAVVGVWAPWAGSWVAGVGEADTADAFRIANVTRSMTCDVLYQVAAEGTVSLDDPVTDYVASIASVPSSVTLRSLCDGTSGLGSYSARIGSDFLDTPERRWNPNELVAYGVGSLDASLIGTTWRDSDAAYVLLGLALEKATGRSAGDLFDAYVVDPLGLTATGLPGGGAAAPGDPALTGLISQRAEDGTVACADTRDVTVLSSSMGFTNSGAVSTVTELGTYVQALATGALLPEGADRFASPMPVGPDQPSWFSTAGGAYLAGSLIGQYGSAPGYITAAFSDPATGLTVAVVLNNSVAPESLGAYLAWELAAIASKAPAASGETAPPAGLPWTAQQFHDAITAYAVCAPPAS
ncbi:serine hydrolase domain-containing protein [Microbacterium sp. GXF7504]